MAFASSRIGAQEAIIKPCDLCEDEENVNWFCTDCVQNLCDRCKKMHLKTTNCKNHHLVSILEGVAITKKNVTNLCKDHEEPFSFFCRSCDKNICTKCLSMTHKKHDFIDIRELQSELLGQLDDVLKEKEDEKEQISKNLDALVEYKKSCTKKLTESYGNIDATMKAIHFAVDEEGKHLKMSLKTTTDRRLTEAKENQRKLEAKKNAYDEEIQTVRQELTLQTASTLNQFVKTSSSKLQSLKPISFLIQQSGTFIVGRVDNELIRNMIGKDTSMLGVSRQQEIFEKVENNILTKLNIVSIYNLPVENECYSICTSPDRSIWIGGVGYVYKMSSDCSTVLHQIPTRMYWWPCCYIACLQSGDAVVSYGGYSYVDRFTSDGRRVEFTDLSSRPTYDIAVTNHDEVVVGVRVGDRDHAGLFSSITLPTTSIVILSNKGNQLKEIKMDTNLDTFCIDQNGNFITSDGTSPCLTTLDRRGAVLKRRQIKKHNIQQMTCDNHGNVLVVFKREKEVYLISDDGKIERSFIIQCDRGINGICIDRESRLLILVDNKKVVVTKYLQ